jgi:hypothetical protein
VAVHRHNWEEAVGTSIAVDIDTVVGVDTGVTGSEGFGISLIDSVVLFSEGTGTGEHLIGVGRGRHPVRGPSRLAHHRME